MVPACSSAQWPTVSQVKPIQEHNQEHTHHILTLSPPQSSANHNACAVDATVFFISQHQTVVAAQRMTKNEGKRARRPSNKPEWKQRNASEKHSGRAEKPAERKKAKAKKIKKGRATRRNMGPYQDPSWIGGNPKGVKNQNPFTQHLNLKEVEQQKHQER